MSDYTPNSGTFPLGPTGASGLANTGQTEQNYDYVAEFFGDTDGHTNYSNSGQEIFATPLAAAPVTLDKQGSSAQEANATFGNSDYQQLMLRPVTGTRIQNNGSQLVQQRSRVTTTQSGGSASNLVQSETDGRQAVARTASRVDPHPLNLGDVRKIQQFFFWHRSYEASNQWFVLQENDRYISEVDFSNFINAHRMEPENITLTVTYDGAASPATTVGPHRGSNFVMIADLLEEKLAATSLVYIHINSFSPVKVTFGDLGWRLGWFDSPSPVIWNPVDHWSMILFEQDGVTKAWTKMIHPNTGKPVTMAAIRVMTAEPEWLLRVRGYLWHRGVDCGWISDQNGNRLSLFVMRNSNDDVFVTSDVPSARMLIRKLVDGSDSAIKFKEFAWDTSISLVNVVDKPLPLVFDSEVTKNGQLMYSIKVFDKDGKVKNVYPDGKESTMADSVNQHFKLRGTNTGCVQNNRAKAKRNAAGAQGGQSAKSAKKRKVGNVDAMGDDEPGSSFANEWDDAVDMAFMS